MLLEDRLLGQLWGVFNIFNLFISDLKIQLQAPNPERAFLCLPPLLVPATAPPALPLHLLSTPERQNYGNQASHGQKSKSSSSIPIVRLD